MLLFSFWLRSLKSVSTLVECYSFNAPCQSETVERENQQQIPRKPTGLASIAAPVLLEAGVSPVEALRLLELGRSVTNSQLPDYRSDIPDLMEHHLMLAEEFDSLLQRLDSPYPSIEPSDINE